MSATFDCVHCGASLPIPEDLAAVSVHCHYCNASQPVPDLAERRRAIVVEAQAEQERRQSALAAEQGRALQRDIQKQTKWAMLPGLLIGGFSVVFAIAMMVRSFLIMPGGITGGGSHVTPPSLALGWDGSRTLECHRADTYDLIGVSATLKGVAIRASNGCVINFTGGTIKADTAIQAWGGAVVTLTGVTIESTTAVDASGNATVTVRGGKVSGKVKKSGGAKVVGL